MSSRYNTLSQVMSKEQELEYYNQVLDNIIKNPRYYLDNLDTLDVFRVSFLHYRAEKTTAL